MTNLELSEAIEVSKNSLKTMGTGYPEHPIVLTHLEELLAEQLRRATTSSGESNGT